MTPIIIKQCFSDDQCDRLLAGKLNVGSVTYTNDGANDTVIHPYIPQTCKRYFNFNANDLDLDWVSHTLTTLQQHNLKNEHPVHIVEYDSGDFLSEHVDNVVFNNRKLTTVTMLSDPTTVSGGELTINSEICSLDKGDMVIFEATDPHQVLPIISGTRQIAVVWWVVGELTQKLS